VSRLIGWAIALWVVAASVAVADPAVSATDRVVIPVSDVARAARFLAEALDFEVDEGAVSLGAVLHLHRENIELIPANGREYPADTRGDDRWFQHLAIVVSDLDRAYARVVQGGGKPISVAPQTLPAWNPNAAGIRAVYFRDLDRHPLELIQFPAGKGDGRWQDRSALFLGIDHTAIAVGDTEASLGFYRRLGLRVAGTSDNWGIEQERLSAVPGAHVRITTLRAEAGPGIEFLQYLSPNGGRQLPADTRSGDLWAEEIVFVATAGAVGERLRDPDGHRVRIVPLGEEQGQ
jgi:catechol 2,3-dioxygenase-like lactoylglutathione lyase family enzyme